MIKLNPTCGCGEDAICNETELQCDPCCRCIPLRLCATFHAYGCDCDGNSDLMEIDENYEYIGAIGCGSETLDLLVFLFYENQVCYWRVISETFYIDELFEIGPYGQSCEDPVLEFEVAFEDCSGTVTIRKYELERLFPRVDEYCLEEPWCGACSCVCKTLCVTRRENGSVTHQELNWDEYSLCWGDICLIRDDYTGECLVVADGYDPVAIGDCAAGLSFVLQNGYDSITAHCKECVCRICVGCCFPLAIDPGTGIPYLKDLEWEISAPGCPDIDGQSGIFHPISQMFPIDGTCGFCAAYENISDAPVITGQFPTNVGPDPYDCLHSPCSGPLCFELCCEQENASGGSDDEACCNRLRLLLSSSAFEFSGGRPRTTNCLGQSGLPGCDSAPMTELSPISCVCDPESGMSAIFSLEALGFVCNKVVQSGPCAGEPDCCIPFDCSFAGATLSIAVRP